MKRRERALLINITRALSSVPGVTNPMAAKAIADYHVEMQHVRSVIVSLLYGLVDAAEPSDYQDIRQRLNDLERWISARKQARWENPDQADPVPPKEG